MAIDHNRPLPVAPERVRAVALQMGRVLEEVGPSDKLLIYQIALQGEQIEYLNNVAFFLQEAHDIYNARFR